MKHNNLAIHDVVDLEVNKPAFIPNDGENPQNGGFFSQKIIISDTQGKVLEIDLFLKQGE